MIKTRKLNLSSDLAHDDESEGTWAISYGDLITLLLSFFVIFFTTDPAKQKVEKMNSFLGFQIEGLNPLADDIKKSMKVEAAKNFEDIKDLSDLNIKAEQIGDSLVISFGPVSFFDSGRSELKKSSQKLLKSFIELYNPYVGNYILSIKGFTDKNPIRRSRWKFKDNLELSAMRSLSAMRFFKEAGIPFKRMEIAGQGELESINALLSKNKTEQLTKEQMDSYSRTLVLVIKPDPGAVK